MAKSKGSNRNTIIIVGFIILVLLILVLFKTCTRTTCSEVKFDIHDEMLEPSKTDTLIVNKPYTFSDHTDKATSWEWNFNDSTAIDKSQNPVHSYKKEGDYLLQLTVNGKCTPDKLRTIHVISGQIAVIDTTTISVAMGKIEGPSTITFGQVATFKDASSEATSWSWEFGETGKTDATEKEAKYMYKSPGMKEVRLMINGTGKSTTMKVFVKPMPAPNPGGGGASKKAPAITESQFIQKLKDIIAKKEKGVTIFAPYVCSYTDLPITVNGQGMSFNSYCTGLRVNGELVKNISAAKLSVDPATGCITNIAITQEKNAE